MLRSDDAIALIDLDHYVRDCPAERRRSPDAMTPVLETMTRLLDLQMAATSLTNGFRSGCNPTLSDVIAVERAGGCAREVFYRYVREGHHDVDPMLDRLRLGKPPIHI